MLAFVAFGYDKFDASPRGEWVPLFAKIGFGQWFRYATGVIEIAGGVLFLFPRTCLAGAVLLVCTMLGAIVAHVTVLGDPFSSIIPLVLAVGVLAIAFRMPETKLEQLMHRPAARPLIRRPAPGPEDHGRRA